MNTIRKLHGDASRPGQARPPLLQTSLSAVQQAPAALTRSIPALRAAQQARRARAHNAVQRRVVKGVGLCARETPMACARLPCLSCSSCGIAQHCMAVWRRAATVTCNNSLPP